MTMACCEYRCDGQQETTSGWVRIEELDRVVAMASAALTAKSRHIEAEAAARQAVEAELLTLRRDSSMIRAEQESIVDDETAFIRSQVEALLKTKAVMAREAQELSRANALLTAEVQLLSSELERVTMTPQKATPRKVIGIAKKTHMSAYDATTLTMTPTTPSPPHRLSTSAALGSSPRDAAPSSLGEEVRRLYDAICDEREDPVPRFGKGDTGAERRARERAETIATRAITLAMTLVNESNSGRIGAIIESHTINTTPRPAITLDKFANVIRGDGCAS